MKAHSLEGGFKDPARQSAQAFRALMEVLARPGTILPLSGAMPPAPLSAAAGSLLLTLVDGDTPLYLAGACDTQALRHWLAFHTGAPLVPPERAQFAVGHWADLSPLDAYGVGTAEYPDRSTTLIVELEALTPRGARLSGPGIASQTQLSLPECAAFQANHARFPLGWDVYFTCGDQVAALPRSTHVTAEEC